ncbi:MAG: hypothetical protein K0R26_1907 [Bacteroidota bacterium]|jgi:hypothetical protein|nr:hypothetical protein [Bacteroidota bacterium]
MKTSTKIILGIVVLSAIAGAFFFGRSVGKKSVKTTLPAPTPILSKPVLETVKQAMQKVDMVAAEIIE